MKIILTVILTLFIYSTVQAAKPLYEIGLAAGVGRVPDYPSSDQSQVRTLATPSFVYRGDIFRQDRRGTRARLFKSENIDIDLSFAAAFNSNSDNNDARAGMDDLDWIFEIGPRLNVTLIDQSPYLLELELPLRLVTSTDGQFTRERGLHFAPQLDLRLKLNSNYTFSTSFKLNYGSETLNDYLYQVETKDVTSKRERFNANAGYLSNTLSSTIIYQKNKLLLVSGVSYSTYNGSVNEESPLYRSNNNTTLYFAFNYFFYQSKKLVD